MHSLFSLRRTMSISDAVEALKIGSSKWMKIQGVRGFAWQSGYGTFSIGESQREAVIRYVQRQPDHHRRVSFQDEYQRLLKRYRIQFDERYVWD